IASSSVSNRLMLEIGRGALLSGNAVTLMHTFEPTASAGSPSLHGRVMIAGMMSVPLLGWVGSLTMTMRPMEGFIALLLLTTLVCKAIASLWWNAFAFDVWRGCGGGVAEGFRSR